MITADELERITRQTLARLRSLSPVQRDQFVERILTSDPQLGQSLARAYRDATYSRRLAARGLAIAIRRDGVM